MANSSNFSQYKQTVRTLSDQIVEAQRPIRILDAIKWDDGIQQTFFRNGCSELPSVNRAYYEARPLGFDPVEKRREFHELERSIQAQLGQFNPVGVIMRRMCREYQLVVRMLESRGLPEFSNLSQELYGSASDVFHASDPTLADLGFMMSEALRNIDQSLFLKDEERCLTSDQAVVLLQERLARTFPDPERPIRVVLSDGIISDAAAGIDYIKVRKDAMFSHRDLKILEVHEGWVHVGTTLNGLSQPVCTFLGKGPPSSTVTQEGLALLMEVIAFASYPARLRRVTNRICAVDLAEKGANFLDVFQYYRQQGLEEADAYSNAMRVFRGSTPDGKPFTKDISYSKGFVLVYNYIQLAVRKGLLGRIPLIFCGKTTLEDLRTLSQLMDEGILEPPKYLPPMFADMNALTAWMCYSNFLGMLNLQQVETDYANIL